MIDPFVELLPKLLISWALACQIHLKSRNKLFRWGANPPFIVVKLQVILGNENISIEQVRFTSQIEKKQLQK